MGDKTITFEDYMELSNKTITFADYMEKVLGMNYSSEEKEYLNKIFMTRETTLKPRRKDGQSERRALLASLAKNYEEFIFNKIKRRMEEQYIAYTDLRLARFATQANKTAATNVSTDSRHSQAL